MKDVGADVSPNVKPSRKKALEARAAALDAKRFNELNKELAGLTGKLTGFQGLQHVIGPFSRRGSRLSVLDRDMVAKYGLMWLGLLGGDRDISPLDIVPALKCSSVSRKTVPIMPALPMNAAPHLACLQSTPWKWSPKPCWCMKADLDGQGQGKRGRRSDVYNISIGEQKLLSYFRE